MKETLFILKLEQKVIYFDTKTFKERPHILIVQYNNGKAIVDVVVPTIAAVLIWERYVIDYYSRIETGTAHRIAHKNFLRTFKE